MRTCIRYFIIIFFSCLLKGSAVFDFTGTTHQVHGNCNAPRAITLSALIYCLRCMVGHDVPLNQVSDDILFTRFGRMIS